MRVSLHTGLRISDVLDLKTAQLASRFWIIEKKTGKHKYVGLPAPLLEDLKANAGETYVFPSRSNPAKPRTRQAVWSDVKRAALAFRLPQNVAPHSFRKAYAVELFNKYGDIEKVRKALNHKNAETTTIYALADLFLEQKYKKRRKKA